MRRSVGQRLRALPEAVDGTFRRPAIPEGDLLAGLPVAGEDSLEATRQRFGVDQLIGSMGDRDRPLGVLTQRQARDMEIGRFLLDVMLTLCCHPLTITPVEKRHYYMATLEAARVGEDILPFA